MKTYQFNTALKRPDGIGTWHYIDTPIQVEKEFDTKGKVRICGNINTIPFHSTLIPRGNGEHYIVLDKIIREKAKIEVGDQMKIEIWQDHSERKVTVPSDFKTALSKKKSTLLFFKGLAYSHQKAYIDWVNDAKKEETRKNRIVKSILKLADKKKLK
ncbi:MAG: hypothetical protein COA49_00040 [Bacteroidetes bacterium]|nr:MAG: hypothetical protein COA49_00040 [Bacteroidota bacterium]